MKKFFKLTLILGLAMVINPSVFAADVTVVFNNSAPNTVSGDKLFNEVNWLPGFTVEKTIEVRNDDPDDSCELSIYTINETETTRDPPTIPSFAGRLFTAIELAETSGVVYGHFANPTEAAGPESLQSVYDASYITFDVLGSGGDSNTYNWVVTFDKTAGNEYQEASTQFDLVLVCEEIDDGPVDKTQRDRRPKMDHGGGGDDGGDEGGGVAGTATFFAPFIPPEVPPEEPEEVAGVETVEGFEEPGEVGGVGTCVDPWWWWLVFVLQIVLHLWIKNSIEKKHLDKRDRFYIAELLVGVLFFVIFWKYFCPWWDKWVSLLISISGLYLTRRRFKKFED